ncbi:thiol:disulfide interchange protein DsbG [Pseudomonas sp. MYb185]|uniref:thiol:disulfide interchange protein DsbG n=1 Tax=Pseudomonas sp. MYb185 TaxID=1848729 RepID=UPI000CFDE6B0|nr:thiol:disulfide interchange protein DsbG [Pseudomonas sp. MYb185]PRB82012.1 thiol:disulfide interchange protein DsbG [Pseudomonas sp. MYb185]
MLLRSTPYPWIFGITAVLMAGCSQAQDSAQPAALQSLQEQGIDIIQEFEVGNGLRGFAGAAGDQPIGIYVAPDGSAIVGTRIAADGSRIDDGRLQELVAQPLAERTWAQLDKAAWVQDGELDAPRVVYAFSDPNCPYCNQFWQAARPWVDAGKVQLRHVMVGMLRADSATKAAAILDAADSTAALTQNETRFADGGIAPAKAVSAATQQRLDDNQRLMVGLGFRGTPGIVARGSDGLLQKLNGLPRPDALLELLGPRPTTEAVLDGR